jgi:hypothetical protein
MKLIRSFRIQPWRIGTLRTPTGLCCGFPNGFSVLLKYTCFASGTTLLTAVKITNIFFDWSSACGDDSTQACTFKIGVHRCRRGRLPCEQCMFLVFRLSKFIPRHSATDTLDSCWATEQQSNTNSSHHNPVFLLFPLGILFLLWLIKMKKVEKARVNEAVATRVVLSVRKLRYNLIHPIRRYFGSPHGLLQPFGYDPYYHSSFIKAWFLFIPASFFLLVLLLVALSPLFIILFTASFIFTAAFEIVTTNTVPPGAQ